MATPQQNAAPELGQLNSTQINIAITVDVAAALATNSLENTLFLMDNSPLSENKGTPRLETVCRQGQVLNWLIYAMDSQRRPNGTWPPFAKIISIVFIEEASGVVTGRKVCTDFKIFGGPDDVRSPLTPAYSYWAGTVLPSLPPGRYSYRLVLEIQDPWTGSPRLYSHSGPALRVIPLDACISAAAEEAAA